MTRTAERLRRAVVARGWSYRRLARELQGAGPPLLGVSPSSLLNYKEGRTDPPIGVLARIAEVLQVSPRWLIEGEGEMEAEIDDLIVAFAESAQANRDEDNFGRELVEGMATLPVDFGRGAARQLFLEVIQRRIDIERMARSAAGDDDPIGFEQIRTWVDDLVGLVLRPWGLDLLPALTPHEFRTHATGVLTALQGAMGESYRSHRVRDAHGPRGRVDDP